MTDKPVPPQSPGLREALIDLLWEQMTFGIRQTKEDRKFYGEAVDALCAALAAQSPVLPPSGGPGLQPTPENIRYILQYGGSCRDCADRDGMCDNGTPCNVKQFEAVIKHTLAAISYGSTHGFYPPLSASVAGEATTEERGWLIEVRADNGTPTYHQLVHDDDWTFDANKALRFARREDAQAYIDHIGWTNPKAVEHMWVGPKAAPSPALDPGTVECCAKVAEKRTLRYSSQGGQQRADESHEIAKDIRALASPAQQKSLQESVGGE